MSLLHKILESLAHQHKASRPYSGCLHIFNKSLKFYACELAVLDVGLALVDPTGVLVYYLPLGPLLYLGLLEFSS